MQYSFDCSDFKKYLFESNKKFKVEGLSIWVNTIPIPVDIFNEFFDRTEELFSLYLDHLIGAVLLGSAVTDECKVQLKLLPDKNLVENNLDLVSQLIESELYTNYEIYRRFAEKASDYLGLENYSIETVAIVKALSHKGKKYSRLYCPPDLKTLIKNHRVKLLDGFAISNFDMFGNVIADEMGIYRIGFSDALAQIFSRLLDFKINECSGFSLSEFYKREDREKNLSEMDFGKKVVISKTTDGSLWEPLFDGEYKVRINPKHPYFSKIPALCEESRCYYELLFNLAQHEATLFNSNHVKMMESLRIDISRSLWLEND